MPHACVAAAPDSPDLRLGWQMLLNKLGKDKPRPRDPLPLRLPCQHLLPLLLPLPPPRRLPRAHQNRPRLRRLPF